MVQRDLHTLSSQRFREDTITTLYAGGLGRLEYVQCSGRRRERGGITNTPRCHIVLPLSGSFVWHPAADEVFADSTKALFVGGGEDFAISHPAGGDRSLVIWPSSSAIEEITRRQPKFAKRQPAFATRVRRSSCDIQLLQRVLVAACTRSDDVLAVEELLVRLLVLLIDDGSGNGMGDGVGANRTLSRAKSVLQAQSSTRVTLVQAANAVGVSPVYLTQLFSAAEGMPLYQYALNLRMVAALDALAESEDITRVAIDLGFSSHSHFSAAFRSRFGATPSTVRAMLRGQAPRDFEVRPLCSARGGANDLPWTSTAQ